MMTPTIATPRGATASLLASAEPDHPDTTLLRAWADWVTAEREFQAAPDDEADDPAAPYNLRAEVAQQAIGETHALTPAGVAVKVRLALSQIDETGDVRRAILAGSPLDALANDGLEFREDLLRQAIEDLERMAAA